MYFWTSVFIQDQLLWSVVFALYNMFTALIFTKLYFFLHNTGYICVFVLIWLFTWVCFADCFFNCGLLFFITY